MKKKRIPIPKARNGRRAHYAPIFDKLVVGGGPAEFALSRRDAVHSVVTRYNRKKGNGKITVRVTDMVRVYREEKRKA